MPTNLGRGGRGVSELLTVVPTNIIFGKSRGQRISRNISLTFSSVLHFYMEDNIALETVYFKSFHSIPLCCTLILSKNISFQPNENPKI